jgi:UBA/THIF-type NAD/FAD binding protein
MLNQFSRTELLFGKEAMEKLSNSRVAVFGIGGVGGYAVEALARSGVGELDLIDDDKVCLTNINRQIIATRKTVGKYKVDVAEERVHDICPDIKVNTYKCFYMPDTADQFDFTQYDYIIDVADIYQTKVCPLAKVMRRELKKAGIKSLKVVYSEEQPIRPIEDMAISCRQDCICPPGTARKCTVRRDIPGSTAFVPSVVGLIVAGEVIKDLAKK